MTYTDPKHLTEWLGTINGIQRHIEHREYTISRVRRTPSKQRATVGEPFQFFASFTDNSRLPDWYPASAETIKGIHDNMCTKFFYH